MAATAIGATARGASGYSRATCARTSEFLQRRQLDLLRPASLEEIIRFVIDPNHPYNSRHPALMRGAYRDRHGRWVRDAMDAAASGARGVAGRASACERSASAQTNGA